MHKVVWPKNVTYGQVCEEYVRYVKRNYGPRATIVFDGYEDNLNNTKVSERTRRSLKTKGINVQCSENAEVRVKQSEFLSRDKNKTILIRMLRQKLVNENHTIYVASADADTLIVNTAISLSSSATIVLVGQDIDLLVLLVALAPTSAPLYFLKPSIGRQPEVLYSIVKAEDVQNMKESVLLAHAISGSDTTSCLYGRSKTRALKLLCESKFDSVRRTFLDAQVTPKTLFEEGCKYLSTVYGARKYLPLNELRFQQFAQKT